MRSQIKVNYFIFLIMRARQYLNLNCSYITLKVTFTILKLRSYNKVELFYIFNICNKKKRVVNYQVRNKTKRAVNDYSISPKKRALF